MHSPDESEQSRNEGPKHFVTTHWSAVIKASGDDSSAVRAALVELCQTYRFPVYSHIRRQVSNPQDAEDLTQEFFSRMIRKGFLAAADPERGKFRSFLLMTVKRFLANEWDRARALKRGGGEAVLSLDVESAESRYLLEPSHDVTPELIFERRWAMVLLERVLARLAGEYAATGRATLFEELRGSLLKDPDSLPYSELATRLNLTEAAIKMAVQRARNRYREILREEIGKTVADPAEIEEEIRHLINTFNS